MATIKNLVIDQGASFSATITVRGAAGAAQDLTGATVVSQMRRSYNSNTAIDFVATIVDPPTLGQIQISLTATDTTALRYGRYVYDIEVTLASGKTHRVIEGLVTVTPGVTRE